MDKPQLETLNRKAAEMYDKPVSRSIATSYYLSIWTITLLSLILILVSLIALNGLLAAVSVAILLPFFYMLMNIQRKKMKELLHMERKNHIDDAFETMSGNVKSGIQAVTWIFAFLILIAFLMFNFAIKIGF